MGAFNVGLIGPTCTALPLAYVTFTVSSPMPRPGDLHSDFSLIVRLLLQV